MSGFFGAWSWVSKWMSGEPIAEEFCGAKIFFPASKPNGSQKYEKWATQRKGVVFFALSTSKDGKWRGNVRLTDFTLTPKAEQKKKERNGFVNRSLLPPSLFTAFLELYLDLGNVEKRRVKKQTTNLIILFLFRRQNWKEVAVIEAAGLSKTEFGRPLISHLMHA